MQRRPLQEIRKTLLMLISYASVATQKKPWIAASIVCEKLRNPRNQVFQEHVCSEWIIRLTWSIKVNIAFSLT